MVIKTLIQENIDKLKQIQEKLLENLEDEEADESSESKLMKYLNAEERNFSYNKYDFKEFLFLISKIFKNHYRSHDSKCFINKIERIINNYKKEMLLHFSNFEIFQIFKENKRILLFLFEEQIIKPDESIYSIIIKDKYAKKCYPQYFKIEFNIEQINNKENEEEECDDEDDIETFKNKRKNGENDFYICQLIRTDSVIEFISYINKKNISLRSKIKKSIYETNSFLIDKNPTLIEYALFFGSIQIFQYLMLNNVDLTSSLWLYAIHGKNPEIIHILEENHVNMNDIRAQNCYMKSIKCHHIDIMKYFKDNYYFKDNDLILKTSLKYHNYSNISISEDYYSYNTYHLIQKSNYYYYNYDFYISYKIDIDFLFHLVELDYVFFIDLLIKNKQIDYKKKNYSIKHNENKNMVCTYENIFHFAVKQRKVEIVKMLLKQEENNPNIILSETIEGFDQNYHRVFTETEKNSLVLALEENNVEMFKILLSDQRIDINQKLITKDNQKNILIEKSIIHYVIEKGNIEIFQLLLSNQYFNVDSIIKEKEILKNEFRIIEHTILSKAIISEQIDIVRFLITQPNIDINKRMIETFQKEKNRSKLFKKSKTMLSITIEIGNLDILKLLLTNKNIDIYAKSIEYYEKVEIYEYKKKNKKTKKKMNNFKKIIKERTIFEEADEIGNKEIISILTKQIE